CDGNAGNGCETNLNTDLNNCGACGTVCTTPANATAVCSTGSCDFLCNPGLAKCNGACLDTSADINNCGACDHACAAGEGCCGGACISLNTSSNCGACGSACAADQVCSS